LNLEKLLELISKSVEEVMLENNDPVIETTADTIIFGDGGILDSLGLVSLIVKLEEIIDDYTGQDIQIVDEDALLNSDNNPLKTPASLAGLIMRKLNEE